MSPAEQARIEALEPATRAAYLAYRKDLDGRGIRECATVTTRAVANQLAKVKAGLSANKIGWHQLNRGIDRELFDAKANAWDNEAHRIDLYHIAARLAEVHGFRQIGFNPDGSKCFIETVKNGKKSKTWDPFHIEYRAPYATLAEAIEAEAPELKGLVA